MHLADVMAKRRCALSACAEPGVTVEDAIVVAYSLFALALNEILGHVYVQRYRAALVARALANVRSDNLRLPVAAPVRFKNTVGKAG